MGKKIKVMLQDKTTIILCEDAKSGDLIDLKEINELDVSFIEQVIEHGKDQVYNKKLKELQDSLEKEKENAVHLANASSESILKEKLYELESKYQTEVASLRHQLELSQKDKEKELKELEVRLDKGTTELINQEKTKYQNLENEYFRLQSELNAKLMEKELEIKTSVNEELLELRSTIDTLKKENEIKLSIAIAELENSKLQQIMALKDKHRLELSEKEEVINRLNRQKASLNVKQTGEDLEIWCDNEVKEQMQNGFFNCTWEKDNTIVKNEDDKKGSKADYIFKVYADENLSNDELLTSICLEMKDENPDSVNKQTNEHYYKALDKNRTKKNCKFALLVSNLENDKPNSLPIFKVREYPDMYVVRPGYLMTFLHMVTSLAVRYKDLILKNAEEKLELKSRLEFIEEFDQIKKTYLETPLNNLQKQVDAILKANESITKANETIKSACDDIITKYINGIKDKIDRFDAKLNKNIRKNNIE